MTDTTPESDALESRKLPTGHFGFSAMSLERLGATEYTLVTLAIDKSASITDFRKEIEACVQQVVQACKQSPRADNLLIRMVMFSRGLEEFHGYKLLENCHLDDYKGMLGRLGSATALYDATENAIAASNAYGRELTDDDYAVNSIVIIITDGLNNDSVYGPAEVKAQLVAATQREHVESIVSILVGVNTVAEPSIKEGLLEFQKEAEIDQYVDIGTADAKTLAKLADFVSRSISSQSQALGSGGPSQLLDF